jgi:ABC-type iron transport system FetAB permease component
MYTAVDARLARGATWWEAVRPMIIAAMRLGLTPTLNNMRVLGLVAIPGMMVRHS